MKGYFCEIKIKLIYMNKSVSFMNLGKFLDLFIYFCLVFVLCLIISGILINVCEWMNEFSY